MTITFLQWSVPSLLFSTVSAECSGDISATCLATRCACSLSPPPSPSSSPHSTSQSLGNAPPLPYGSGQSSLPSVATLCSYQQLRQCVLERLTAQRTTGL